MEFAERIHQFKRLFLGEDKKPQYAGQLHLAGNPGVDAGSVSGQAKATGLPPISTSPPVPCPVEGNQIKVRFEAGDKKFKEQRFDRKRGGSEDCS